MTLLEELLEELHDMNLRGYERTGRKVISTIVVHPEEMRGQPWYYSHGPAGMIRVETYGDTKQQSKRSHIVKHEDGCHSRGRTSRGCDCGADHQ